MAKRSLSLGLIIVTCVLATPWVASAQQRDYDPYVSIFGGMALPNKTDVPVTSPSLNATVQGLELDSSATWGGKAGVWMNQFRDMTSLDFGLQLDITNFYPNQAGEKTLPTSSIVAGSPVTFTTSQINMNSTIFAGNILARLPIAVSPEFPNGEMYPYVGGGVGLQRTDYSASGGSGTANDIAYQVLAGFQYMITPNLGLYAEYKYTMSEQNIKVGTQDGKYQFNINHLVAGLAWHF